MIERENFPCPATKTINILKGKFTLEILSEIMNNHNHYGTLMRNIPDINPRILATRLRELEKIDILSRTEIPTNPPQFAYHLTEKGKALQPIVDSMKAWYISYQI